jgi:hypothetical protein
MENSKIVKINESTIKDIVRESIKDILNEEYPTLEKSYRATADLANFLYKNGIKVSVARVNSGYATWIESEPDKAERLVNEYSKQTGVECRITYTTGRMLAFACC